MLLIGAGQNRMFGARQDKDIVRKLGLGWMDGWMDGRGLLALPFFQS
jgi:hypothetical protein